MPQKSLAVKALPFSLTLFLESFAPKVRCVILPLFSTFYSFHDMDTAWSYLDSDNISTHCAGFCATLFIVLVFFSLSFAYMGNVHLNIVH